MSGNTRMFFPAYSWPRILPLSGLPAAPGLLIGEADSSYADVVPRSELPALEDPGRPELKGTVPVQGWTKAAEPILVGALVVGLVALFYTNRP